MKKFIKKFIGWLNNISELCGDDIVKLIFTYLLLMFLLNSVVQTVEKMNGLDTGVIRIYDIYLLLLLIVFSVNAHVMFERIKHSTTIEVLLIKALKDSIIENKKLENELKHMVGDEVEEDYELLVNENKNMAEHLKGLGYTNEQISEICNK